MALIETIDESNADGELRAVYQQVMDPQGHVAHILQVQSLSPRSLLAHYQLYRELMFGENPLSRGQRELIAVAVSHANACHY